MGVVEAQPGVGCDRAGPVGGEALQEAGMQVQPVGGEAHHHPHLQPQQVGGVQGGQGGEQPHHAAHVCQRVHHPSQPGHLPRQPGLQPVHHVDGHGEGVEEVCAAGAAGHEPEADECQEHPQVAKEVGEVEEGVFRGLEGIKEPLHTGHGDPGALTVHW